MSRTTRLSLSIAAIAGTMVFSLPARAGGAKTFFGEIADSQCALNVHSLSKSHNEMMNMKPEIKTESDCARYCVKERGGKFVLQTKDNVYKLDAQVLAEEWLGLKVKVVGTLDPKTGTITVESIAPQAPNSNNAARPN
ncbi:MAG TPA: DUF5818 domain-containing protein [Candidatus Acidoferrum sp.]|nr:DUF5818 domain-containing protein [Candidatus Acidoferrum sp.]